VTALPVPAGEAGTPTVPVALVDPSPDQNRETFDPAELAQLADSLRELGLIQPIRVRPNGQRYVLVAGERRLRAARDLLGWTDIPAVVDAGEDRDAALGTLAENLLRVDPSPLEEAAGYRHVLDQYGFKGSEVAKRVGVPAERVKRRLGLLDLADETRHYLASGQLPVGRAEAMIGLDSNRQHLAIAAHHQGIGTAAYRALCDRLGDEQASETMFDPDSFLRVAAYVAEAETDAAVPAALIRDVPLGVAEIADRLGVKVGTVHQWVHRGRLPDPDFRVSGIPCWWTPTVDAWAAETGRPIK
jgi:ParB family chromosome partitioning protein